MATFNYANSQATANSLLTKFGGSATLRQRTASGDAWNPTQTETDTTVTAVLLDYSDRQIDGTQIRVGDRKAIIAVQSHGKTPTQDDGLVVGSSEYSLVRVMPLQPEPGGTVVMWEAQIRR